jgi:hypothetical protein
VSKQSAGTGVRTTGAWPRAHGAAVGLLGAYLVLALTGASGKSPAFDEVAHLTAGYSYWKTDDYRLQPENGNFPQRWATLPLLVSNNRFPRLDQPDWWQSHVWGVGRQLLYEEGNDPEAMMFQARVMIALLGAALGVVVYCWSTRLYGRAGGLLTLTLYSFSPAALANGSLVTSDMAAALFFVASAWALWRILHHVSPLTVAGSSLALAGLFLSKVSAVLIVPVGLLLALLYVINGRPLTVSLGGRPRSVRGRWGQLGTLAAVAGVQGAVVAACIWAAFDFRYAAFHDSEPGRDILFPQGWPGVVSASAASGKAVEFARQHHLLPEAYLYGFAFVTHYAQERRAFLNGEFSVRGWPWFFPYCFLVKSTLPLFAVLVLAATAVGARWRAARTEVPTPWRVLAWRGLADTAPLWALLAVYWAAAVSSHLNIGHRHLLPTYPVLFILAGAAGFWFTGPRPAPALPAGEEAGPPAAPAGHPWMRRWTVLALVGAAAVALWAWPNYLSYFNLLVGGPWHGYRHLVDSSLDWGQDLPGLKKWLGEHGLDQPGHGGPRVYLSYFGSASPEYYRINATLLPSYLHPRPEGEPEPLTGGVYCISATMLQTVYVIPCGPWMDSYEATYRQLAGLMERYNQTRSDPAARQALYRQVARSDFSGAFLLYDQFRFARLCAFLRQREPDDEVGYSILIYRLSDADIQRALRGPRP